MNTNKIAKRGLLVMFFLGFIGLMFNVCDTRASKDVDRWRTGHDRNFDKDYKR